MIEQTIERMILISRWLMAPIHLGLTPAGASVRRGWARSISAA